MLGQIDANLRRGAPDALLYAQHKLIDGCSHADQNKSIRPFDVDSPRTRQEDAIWARHTLSRSSLSQQLCLRMAERPTSTQVLAKLEVKDRNLHMVPELWQPRSVAKVAIS